MKLKTALFTILMLSVHLCYATIGLSSDLDLSKALVIGNGAKKVIEFTDPDCRFCRNASSYFHNRTDITRYIFFNPLPSHPNARQKAQYILSGKDKARLYNDVMSGKADMIDPRSLSVTPAGIKLQEEQHQIARKAGVDGTPTFMIMGRIIEGFDLPKIESVIGK